MCANNLNITEYSFLYDQKKIRKLIKSSYVFKTNNIIRIKLIDLPVN